MQKTYVIMYAMKGKGKLNVVGLLTVFPATSLDEAKKTAKAVWSGIQATCKPLRVVPIFGNLVCNDDLDNPIIDWEP